MFIYIMIPKPMKTLELHVVSNGNKILYTYRLPIVQGGTFAFLTPTFAILSLPQWTCPKVEGQYQSFLLQTVDGLTIYI